MKLSRKESYFILVASVLALVSSSFGVFKAYNAVVTATDFTALVVALIGAGFIAIIVVAALVAFVVSAHQVFINLKK